MLFAGDIPHDIQHLFDPFIFKLNEITGFRVE
jgi:hypothetical protein